MDITSTSKSSKVKPADKLIFRIVFVDITFCNNNIMALACQKNSYLKEVTCTNFIPFILLTELFMFVVKLCYCSNLGYGR